MIIAELPFTALLRRVKGQSIPELHFQAKHFLAAPKKLQYHQYGQKVQGYQPPAGNMFEAPLSDAPSKPSEEEILLRKLHIQWSDLHAVTRDNLLQFETHGFQLPRMATGDPYMKSLVSSSPVVQPYAQLNAAFS